MSKEYTELRNLRDVLVLYQDSVDKHGASHSLIAFLDVQHGLKSRVGLENFAGLSAEAEHDIIVKTLNPAKLDSLALENLLGRVVAVQNKIRKFVGDPESEQEPPVTKEDVRPLENYQAEKAFFQKLVDCYDRPIVDSIPQTADKEAWIALAERVKNELRPQIGEAPEVAAVVSIDQSGWTHETTQAECEWYNTTHSSYDELGRQFTAKFKETSDWLAQHQDGTELSDEDRALMDAINVVVDAPFGEAVSHLTQLYDAIASTIPHFEGGAEQAPAAPPVSGTEEVPVENAEDANEPITSQPTDVETDAGEPDADAAGEGDDVAINADGEAVSEDGDDEAGDDIDEGDLPDSDDAEDDGIGNDEDAGDDKEVPVEAEPTEETDEDDDGEEDDVEAAVDSELATVDVEASESDEEDIDEDELPEEDEDDDEEDA